MQSGEETIIHPFAKSDAACLCVYPDGRHNSYIYFINVSIRLSRLVNPETATFHRVSKWYHPEACAFHKWQIHPVPLPAQPMDERPDIGFGIQRPKEQYRLGSQLMNTCIQSGLQPMVTPDASDT